MKVKCPHCGVEKILLVPDEHTYLYALVSLSVDFLIFGLFVVLGFLGHKPLETDCPNCEQRFLTRLNFRLTTYNPPSYLFLAIFWLLIIGPLLVILSWS